MVRTSISQALKTYQELKQKQGLHHLDSPTEAAIIALLCNRQDDEEVRLSVGNPAPVQEQYCFADLAPPQLDWSDKMRHYYMLGQRAQWCGWKLAEQQQQHAAHRQQQRPNQPCIFAAAREPATQGDTTHTTSYGTPCRHPSVLRSSSMQQHATDCSPGNSIVRRLAEDIKTGSTALQLTLAEYSSHLRSTNSSINRRSSHHTEHSMSDELTPAASPGRAWSHPPSARQTQDHLDCYNALEFEQHDRHGVVVAEPCSPQPLATGGNAPAAAATGQVPGYHDLTNHKHTGVMKGPGESQALSAVPMSCLRFKGFEKLPDSWISCHEFLLSEDSTQLHTPRLHPCKAVVHSNDSSSNGAELGIARTCDNSNQLVEAVGCFDSARAQAKHHGSHDSADRVCKAGMNAELGDDGVREDEHGYWSCDEDCEGATQQTVQRSVLAMAADMSSDVKAENLAEDNRLAATPQLQLSPLLLKQLSEQTEAKGGVPWPGFDCCTAKEAADDDDATTWCEWATVCSYEHFE